MDSHDQPGSPGERPAADTAAPGSIYFVTLVTKDRQPWLGVPRTRGVFMAVLRSWHMERSGRILAAAVLPDRAHVLLEAGDPLAVGQIVGNWKAATRRGAGYAETFQPDFRGHRLRRAEKPEDYALYLYLQPYRMGLLKPDEQWAGWWLPEAGAFKFPAELTAAGCPPQEWLTWPEEKFAGLAVGA